MYRFKWTDATWFGILPLIHIRILKVPSSEGIWLGFSYPKNVGRFEFFYKCRPPHCTNTLRALSARTLCYLPINLTCCIAQNGFYKSVNTSQSAAFTSASFTSSRSSLMQPSNMISTKVSCLYIIIFFPFRRYHVRYRILFNFFYPVVGSILSQKQLAWEGSHDIYLSCCIMVPFMQSRPFNILFGSVF